MALKIGQRIKGTVTGIQPYGIFVQLDEDTQGLVHISEITYGYVENIREEHQIGDEVEVMVMDIDEFSHKISLSLRATQTKVNRKSKKRRYHPRYSNPKSTTGFKSIEEKMPQWIEESLEYLKAYKRSKKEGESQGDTIN